MLAVVAVLPKRTQAQVSTARKRNARRAVLTRIVVANRYLAQGAHESGRAAATPSVLLLIVVRTVDECWTCHVSRVVAVQFDADGAIATGIGQTCQRAALGYAKAVHRIAVG